MALTEGRSARSWRNLLAAATEEWRATPFYRLMLRGEDPERVNRWGEDLRVGDPQRGMDIVRGAWRIAAEKLPGVHPTPWAAPPPSLHFAARLHSFSWLIDVASAGPAAQEAVSSLIHSWVDGFGREFHAAAWAPELVSERLFAWLCHGRVAFEAGDPFRRADALRSLARQARHLELALEDIRSPVNRIKAGAALALAGVSGVPEGERLRELGEQTLEEAVASQFLADGGHASRSPLTLFDAYCDIATAENAIRRAGYTPSRLIKDALPRMLAMLKFFRMSDGAFPSFHGGAEGLRGAIAAALKESGGKERRFDFATQSAYQRLSAQDLTLLVDVGGAPQPNYGERAHAGALAFELSNGPDRIIVNVGSGRELTPEWRAAGRATNGHSTLVIDDALSALFQQRRTGRGAAYPVGPQVTHKRTEEDDGVLLEAHHDGYRSSYGYLHRRRLFLTPNGKNVFGQDACALPLGQARSGAPAAFAVRFHLHPNVRATRTDVHEITIQPPLSPPWRLITDARRLEIEGSIYLSGQGAPLRSRQIVLYGVADPSVSEDRAPNLVKWKLTRP